MTPPVTGEVVLQDPYHPYAERFIALARAEGLRTVALYTDAEDMGRNLRKFPVLAGPDVSASYLIEGRSWEDVAAHLRRAHHVVAVVPHGEPTVLGLGRLAELLDLPWAQPGVLERFRDKHALKARYTTPYNPYEVALLFCLERALGALRARGETGKRVHVLFESRGRQEDADLELEFRRICDNGGGWGYRQVDFQQMQFAHLFVDKRSNSTGLQLADLVARPLALRHLRPGQANRALQALDGKLLNFKVFP